MNGIRTVSMLLAGILLAGCDYTVPLQETPRYEIVPELVGLWQRPRDAKEQADSLLVLPLTRREYLVSFPAGTPKAMFARAMFCRVDELRLVQLEWLGTGEAQLPEDNKVFQYASYELDKNRIVIRLLNTEVVGGKHPSAAALADAIKANKDHPGLFKHKMVFNRSKSP